MKIILIILLIISLFIIYILGKTILRQAQLLSEIQKYLNEIDFLNGGEIDQELVLNEYKDAILVTSYQEGSEEVISIWDVSQYEKNKVIGLTTCGPSQWVDDAIEKIKEQMPELLEDIDIKELRQELSKGIAQDGILYPGVDVYQMKDGSWLWRKTQ